MQHDYHTYDFKKFLPMQLQAKTQKSDLICLTLVKREQVFTLKLEKFTLLFKLLGWGIICCSLLIYCLFSFRV